MKKRVVIIGGGAAGIFSALICKEGSEELDVIVLEKTNQLLSKVKVSGGGRCNVTHHQFDPKALIKAYPRGSKELLGAFHRFQPQDTVRWFEEQGVTLKTEADGRMFPVTDSSMTIVHCLLETAKKRGVQLLLQHAVSSVVKLESGYEVHIEGKPSLVCDFLILATGGSSQGHLLAQSLGHTITETAPSLFTFNVPTSPLKELSGVVASDVEVSLPCCGLKQRGPLLITHFGFSGPVVLRLSAFAARELKRCQYKEKVQINWIPTLSVEDFYRLKEEKPQKTFASENPARLPQQLWKTLLIQHKIPLDKPFSHLSKVLLKELFSQLSTSSYAIEGKTTHKEEFVTCGGVDLKEIDCKTFESKLSPHLFFVGELLDIDGITGGFNFQNAWTSSFLAASQIISTIGKK